MENEKFKPLNQLKFDTLGDEFLFLLSFFQANSVKISDGEKQASLEELRTVYTKFIQDNSVLETKYEKSSIYWAAEQERAVVQFLTETDIAKRDLIFSKKIYKPLKKLIESIIFKFKLFRNDIDVNELQADCMSFLITKMEKYDPTTGAQAYAYLGTIAKHYLMGEKRIAYKMTKANLDIDENLDEASAKPEYVYHLDDLDVPPDPNSKIFAEIIEKLEEEIRKPKMLNNDKKVGEAIIWIFRNHEVLKVYNKNLVYHLLKERTGLQTKEITYSLSRFKSLYKNFKELFLQREDD